MTQKDQVTRLKEEGNTLFVQKDYLKASLKYTEAIAVDGSNAVLYSNRAACRLAMKQYLDACTDAKKATELDPLYPKAFARLAAAHDAIHQSSVDEWQRALDTLPKENLTPGELKQREQYQLGLKNAKAKEAATVDTQGMVWEAGTEMPWDLAGRMIPELRSQEMVKSSAWVIWSAHEDFMKGVNGMKALQKIQTPQGMMFGGNTNAIAHLTNGVMRDVRVFHIDDPNWVDMYNSQVQLECTRFKAWTEGGPESIIEKAQERLRQEGWDSVRPALSTTVRCWIMRGLVSGKLIDQPGVMVEFFSRALEVLKWGQTAWKNVPRDDRGAIFEDTFVRGLRDLHLEALMEAYAHDPGLHSSFPLENLYEEAVDIFRDINRTSYTALDPGFVLSFMIYPKARALATQGFYHSEMGRLHKNNVSESMDHYSQAAEAYLEAAEAFPEDDEQYAWFLRCALKNMWACGRPLRETLGVMEKIRLALPKMQAIWVNSAMSRQGRDDILKEVLLVEKEALDQIADGKFTLDDRICPAI